MLGDLGKIIIATGFKKSPKVPQIAQLGHTASFFAFGHEVKRGLQKRRGRSWGIDQSSKVKDFQYLSLSLCHIISDNLNPPLKILSTIVSLKFSLYLSFSSI